MWTERVLFSPWVCTAKKVFEYGHKYKNSVLTQACLNDTLLLTLRLWPYRGNAATRASAAAAVAAVNARAAQGTTKAEVAALPDSGAAASSPASAMERLDILIKGQPGAAQAGVKDRSPSQSSAEVSVHSGASRPSSAGGASSHMTIKGEWPQIVAREFPRI